MRPSMSAAAKGLPAARLLFARVAVLRGALPGAARHMAAGAHPPTSASADARSLRDSIPRRATKVDSQRLRWHTTEGAAQGAAAGVEGAGFASMLEHLYPRAVPEGVFVDTVGEVLQKHGFTPKTSISLVSTCRDELTRPFNEMINKKWGDCFNISSLAGFVFCGRTGFKAAMAHSPVVDGRERYVFWIAAHIALDETGEIGKCMRHGREHPSNACGALMAIHNEIRSGKVSLLVEQTDMEMGLVKQELVSHLPYGQVPDLVQLTYAAYECILKQVCATAQASVDPMMCEYAVVAGIQVHGPRGQNYFWPGEIFKVTGYEHERIDLYEDYAKAVSSWHLELKGWNANESLALLQQRSREARLAVREGNVERLKHVGIDLRLAMDNHSRTLLHIAAMHGRAEVLEYLITKGGVDCVDKLDIERRSAMDYAVENGAWAVADLLKKAGAGLEGKVLNDGLVHAVETLDLEMFGRLVALAKDRKEALHATDRDGRSLVALAVGIKEKEMERVKRQQELIDSLVSLGVSSSVDFFGCPDTKLLGSGKDKGKN